MIQYLCSDPLVLINFCLEINKIISFKSNELHNKVNITTLSNLYLGYTNLSYFNLRIIELGHIKEIQLLIESSMSHCSTINS
jgi:hypothetical protein